MANVIHRTTLEFRTSVNTPDYPEPTWKHNPDMSVVAGVPAIYWKAPADWNAAGAGPVEMSQAEKDAVDAALLTAADDSRMAQLNQRDALAAFALVVMDEVNRLSGVINQILDAIDAASNLSGLKIDIAAIANEPIRDAAQIKSAVRTKLEGL